MNKEDFNPWIKHELEPDFYVCRAGVYQIEVQLLGRTFERGAKVEEEWTCSIFWYLPEYRNRAQFVAIATRWPSKEAAVEHGIQRALEHNAERACGVRV